MAQIELGILARQWLDRRIDAVEVLIQQVAAWQHE